MGRTALQPISVQSDLWVSSPQTTAGDFPIASNLKTWAPAESVSLSRAMRHRSRKSSWERYLANIFTAESHPWGWPLVLREKLQSCL
jgi:hypothetical protein